MHINEYTMENDLKQKYLEVTNHIDLNSERINIKDVLKHPFFTENIDRTNIFQENIVIKDSLKNLMNYTKI